MTAVRIDGKELAQKVRAEVAGDVRAFGQPVCLATILVGDDPASHVYVGSKHKASREAGIDSRDHRFSPETPESEILELVADLNADDSVDGILVQLPLPEHMDEPTVLRAVDPARDVDGFHVLNAGRLYLGEPFLVPATPLGIMAMLDEYGVELKGKDAVVIGRSEIVGKPMAMLLLAQHVTVTICHSRTVDLASHTRRADVLVAAVGRDRRRRRHESQCRREARRRCRSGRIRSGRAHDSGSRWGRADDDRDAFAQHVDGGATSPLPGCGRRLVGASVRPCCDHRRRSYAAVTVVGGRTWSRAPSSGFRTRRATASSSARVVTTFSFTSPRSRWTASRPSPKASVWSSRSSRVPRVPRPRTCRQQRADRSHMT